jgi:eight-cysteine-cluster-containing protein
VILALILACSGPRSAAELPVADSPPTIVDGGAAPVDGGTAPVDGTATTLPIGGLPQTPAEAYLGCKERVEGLQTPGECTTDADCAKTGCSQEICVAAAVATEVMGTCEILPCFAALDTCGCHDGQCSWTLAASMPTPGKVTLPPRAP